MPPNQLQHITAQLSGQDDNLGDTVLRDALLRSLKGPGRQIHLFLGRHSTDYADGLSLDESTVVHDDRAGWLASTPSGQTAVHAHKPGEINPTSGRYPAAAGSAELAAVRRSDGIVIVTGVGMKDPLANEGTVFDGTFRDADLVSWRDNVSRDVAGFGEVNPDWAFALGTPTSSWPSRDNRSLLAVTLRYDRPYPDHVWFNVVRAIARTTDTRIVTFAQVSRDAPRAVRLADDLGGAYAIPASFNHSTLDAQVRDLFQRSVAVISDRAHALIIAATEGAVPVGSAADSEKISRMLAAAALGELSGRYDQLTAYGERIEDVASALPSAVDDARARLSGMALRLDRLIASAAP
ncbi:polysaccharide pyruvyl transferase family protein [Microbacterium aurum]